VDAIGTPFASGENQSGELGIGKPVDSVTIPEYVAQDGEMKAKRIVQMSAGNEHSLFVDKDGLAFASGLNEFGELATPGNFLERSPVRVNSGALRGKKVIQVSAGARYSLFLDEDGHVSASGRNSNGEAGDGGSNIITIAKSIPPSGAMLNKRITTMSAGVRHSLFVDDQGTAYACGNQQDGLLGNGQSSDAKVSVPVSISGQGSLLGANVTQAVATEFFSLFLDHEGNVHHTGRNFDSSSHVNVPRLLYKVESSEDKKVMHVAAGTLHALLLMGDNSILYVGRLLVDQVPVATPTPLSSAVSGIDSLCPHVLGVAAGGPHSFLMCRESFAFGAGTDWKKLVIIGLAILSGITLTLCACFMLISLALGALFISGRASQKRAAASYSKPPASSTISKKLLEGFVEENDSLLDSDEEIHSSPAEDPLNGEDGL